MKRPRWTLIETLSVFQVFWLLVMLSVPAHQAVSRVLQRQGVTITWRHQIGLVAGSLIFELILMVLGWAVLFAIVWIFSARSRAARKRRRARRAAEGDSSSEGGS